MARQTARSLSDLSLEGTKETQWSAPDLSEYTNALGYDAESVEALTAEQKERIASTSLMGDAEADTYDDLVSYPLGIESFVEEAAESARSLRGRSSDPQGIEQVTRKILNQKFDQDIEKPENRATADVDLSPPAAMVNAAQLGLRKKDELGLGDCGTGAGETTARMVVNDELTGDRVRKIAGYLRSHEEDYTPDDTPSNLSNEQIKDGCGVVQYLLWGGGTDTAYNWALRKANAVAEKQGDQKPYSDSDFRSMTRADIDSLSEGTLVTWGPSNATRYGEVVEIHTSGSVTSDSGAEDETTMPASDDNPVVEIRHWNWNDEEWAETDTITVHRPDNLEVIDSLPERSTRQYEGRSYTSRINDPEIRQTADGTITVKVMTDQVARDGMVLDPKGLRTEDYMKNPVVLWEHGQDPRRGAEPVARCKNLMRKDDGYIAEIDFASDEFAQRIESKIKNEFLNAVSVGWRTEEVKREERSGDMVPVVKRSDMTEFSVVGVPADTDALVQSRMHYEGMEKEMQEKWPAHRSAIKGLCVMEAARRANGSDMTMEQAKRAVLNEMDDRLIGGRECVMGATCPFSDEPTQFDTLADILSADEEVLRFTAASEGCMYDRTNDDEDSRGCGCGSEGTPSSPSASGGTPAGAERDESPGSSPSDVLIRLCQEVSPTKVKAVADEVGIQRVKRIADKVGPDRIARLYDERAERKAKKEMGVL